MSKANPLINISHKQATSYAMFLVLYEFVTYIANDMIMPGMVQVVHSFHGPESAIATSLTCYVLGGSSLQIFLGPLSDHFGRRPVMLFGAGFFFLCTILIACASSVEQFLLMRFLQGMGLCFITVVGYATLQEIFAEMDAVRLIAFMANISILAPLLGPLLGAIFVYFFNWRFIFISLGGLALIAFVGLWKFMPETVGQIKNDGKKIEPVSFTLKNFILNYKSLLANPCLLYGSIAIGLLALPCVTWIALAPVMLITQAKLTVIQYSLWQIPLFGSSIAGNWFLQRLTHRDSLKKILFVGSIISLISLILTMLLPFLISNYFIWLMPGLIMYFFGLGMVAAPLNRLILFSTEIAKGTASAFISTITMFIQACGIEIGNLLYKTHNNILFGSYCALIGVVYILLLVASFANRQKKISELIQA